MEITGTLSKIHDYFKEWHSKNYTTLHAEDARINGVNDNLNATNNAVLKIMQLLGRKINNANIQSIDDFNNQFNNNSSWNDNTLNLTDINNRINNTSQQFYDGKIIPLGADLNDATYIEPGIYRHPDNDVQIKEDNVYVKQIANIPDDLYIRFNLRVLKYVTGSYLQILSAPNNSIYIRNRYNGEWGQWFKLYNESKLIITNDIGWGQEFAATPGPINTSMIPDINANRLAFLPGECINIYTNDNKTITYKSEANNNASLTNTAKKSFISGSYKLYGGGKDAITFLNTETDINKKIVVEIKAVLTKEISGIPQDIYQVYAKLRKMYVHINKNRCENVTLKVKIDGIDKNGNPISKELHQNEEKYKDNGYPLIGYQGGWNVIPLDIYFGDNKKTTNDDNYTTESKNDHYHTITLTFENKDVKFATSPTNENDEPNEITTQEMYCVDAIRFVGEQIYTAPSTMAETGHIYEYDGDQNITFPSDITIKGNVNGIIPKRFVESENIDNGRYRLIIYDAIKVAELYFVYNASSLQSLGPKATTNLTKNNSNLVLPDAYRPKGDWAITGATQYGAPFKVKNDGTIEFVGPMIDGWHYGSCMWSYQTQAW